MILVNFIDEVSSLTQAMNRATGSDEEVLSEIVASSPSNARRETTGPAEEFEGTEKYLAAWLNKNKMELNTLHM